MRYEVVLAPEAARAYRSLPAYRRAEVRDALERHLRHEPTRISKSRIKRLRGLSQPQYRLRVGEVRVFYDVTREGVEVLAIVTKAEAANWLAEHGKPASVLIGFESEDDWFDYRLEHHPEFLRRVAQAREALRSGRGVRLEDLPS